MALPDELDLANLTAMVARIGRWGFAVRNCIYVPLRILGPAVAEERHDLQGMGGNAQRRKPAGMHFQRQSRAQRMAFQARKKPGINQRTGSPSHRPCLLYSSTLQ